MAYKGKLAAAAGIVTLGLSIVLPAASPANAASTAPAAITTGAHVAHAGIVQPHDPPCGYEIYNEYLANGSEIYTEAPKCGQKVRAVANCLATGAAGKVYGNTLSTAGYSKAQCGDFAERTQHGYQIWKGSWGSISWF